MKVTLDHNCIIHLANRTDVGKMIEAIVQDKANQSFVVAGQLAMLRRLAGSPVPPENFIVANISISNVGPDQRAPVSPDVEWPEGPVGSNLKSP